MATPTPATPVVRAVNASSRRRFLSGTAAALTGAGFAAVVLSPDPDWSSTKPSGAAYMPGDAHRLAFCALFHAHQEAAEATANDDDEGLAAAQARGWEVQPRIRDIPPTTAAGRAAKAHVALRLLASAEGPPTPQRRARPRHDHIGQGGGRAATLADAAAQVMVAAFNTRRIREMGS